MSPLVGLGSTRDVQGNFNTIAGGATEMPPMHPPALGTQGQYLGRLSSRRASSASCSTSASSSACSFGISDGGETPLP